MSGKSSSLLSCRRTSVFLLFAATVSVLAGQARGAVPQSAGDDTSMSALARVTADIKYLASDELVGRLPGTPEMVLAENYIIDDFRRIGLKSAVADGSYKQTFSVGESRILNREATRLVLTGPSGETSLTLDEDFKPQTSPADIDVSGGLVFVGYGIRSDELNYNEYRDVDVNGKVVVVFRMEPQQADPESVFDGAENSRYAFIQAKVAAAREAGAEAILFVNDGVTASDDERDTLADYELFAQATGSMPFFHVKRKQLDRILASTPLIRGTGEKIESLAAAEAAIDKSLEPLSQELAGWSVSLKASYTTSATLTNNIVGVIDGEGPFAEETIVIGAHYDHLGMGAFGSRSGPGEIHNGADDNATGTASVMELARRFVQRDKKPARRIVFICFSAEEMGLLGAVHYCNEPLYPLENTVAMINFDMTGWLRDNKLTVYSWETSPQFEPALDKANTFGLDLQKPSGGFAGSDHLIFLQRNIPVMFLHTGLTSTYHTPEDDFESINLEGVALVVDFTEKLVDELAALPTRPVFGPVQRPRLGVVLIENADGNVSIEEVRAGGLAAESGFQAGDVILAIDGEPVPRRRAVNQIMNRSAGKTLKFKLRRGEAEIEIDVAVPEGS
jgi:sulfur carrier protein ThiS